MEKNIEVAVGVFCLDRERRICLVRPRNNPQWLTIPGGHPIFGETLEASAAREFLEETGTSISQLSYISWIELCGSDRHLILFNFTGFAAKPCCLSNDHGEINEVVWWPLDQAKNDPRVLPRHRDEMAHIFA